MKGRAVEGELTLQQIAELFGQLIEDGSPRSVSAVFRIFREQSRGRHDEVVFGRGGAMALPLVAILAAVEHCLPDRTPSAALSALVFAAPSAFFAWRTRDRILRNGTQLRELRRLTLETLDSLVLSPWFVPKPLDRENARSLRSLKGVDSETWFRVSRILEETE